MTTTKTKTAHTANQQIKEEEEKLNTALYKIYNKIQRDLKDSPFTDIKYSYHKQTDDLIRSSVTTIYEISAKRTVEKDVKVPYFLTEMDLQEIRRLSRKYQDKFWLALSREVQLRNQLGVKTKYDPVTLLLIRQEDKVFRQGFISRITESIHGEVAAWAVVSKAKQVVEVNRVDNRGVKYRGLSKTVYRKAAAEATERTPHVTWKATDMACPKCSLLDGTRYLLDDPDTPIPSADERSHPRCKCQLVLEDAAIEVEEAAELFF